MKNILEFLGIVKPMRCYNVTCVDDNGKTYEVGVMTRGDKRAMKCAVKSLKEGRHLETVAISAMETDAI